MINPISFAEPNSTACTAVMILQDTDLEGPVGITLVLLNPNPTIMGFTPQTATLTALDINRKFPNASSRLICISCVSNKNELYLLFK